MTPKPQSGDHFAGTGKMIVLGNGARELGHGHHPCTLVNTFETHASTDHFVDANKMVDLGSGRQREASKDIDCQNACHSPCPRLQVE